MTTGAPTVLSENVMAHSPELSVQDTLDANVAVELLLDQETMPVGEFPYTMTLHVVEEPTMIVDGVHVTSTPVVTEIVIDPELPRLCESPAYVAVIVGLPTDVSLNATEHDSELSIQEFGETSPDVLLNDTVPVVEFPVTVALQVIVEPAGSVAAQETVVVVGGF